MRYVNQAVPKLDAQALVTGQAVYTDDIAPDDCLIVKVLRSPHAHALIRDVQLSRAKAVPGSRRYLPIKTVRINDLLWQVRRTRNPVRTIV